ncbi:MAG: PrgI family protein [Candidatus Levybacteria bacterium]|nr:PrgI family protein [Candidatus Levybacteria bacterium]
MENHPIPQDVTGFQFKLIGDMTIKQFAYLAVGIVLAWILFQLPIILLIKLPFCLFFAFLGIGLAFLPVSGRPMDLMIANFIKALFRPTQFVYKKTGTPLFPKNAIFAPTQYRSVAIPAATISSSPIPSVTPIASPKPAVPSAPAQASAPKIVLIPPKHIASQSIPEFPNLIIGTTRDSRGNPLPNILIEIKDKEGNPVRAFKTNEVGRFASATPLLSGVYTIEFEDTKGQNKFETKTINAAGQVIPPIAATSIDAREELRKSLFSGSTT